MPRQSAHEKTASEPECPIDIAPWQVRDYATALLEDLEKMTARSGLHDMSNAISEALRKTR